MCSQRLLQGYNEQLTGGGQNDVLLLSYIVAAESILGLETVETWGGKCMWTVAQVRASVQLKILHSLVGPDEKYCMVICVTPW
jgi:type IV secretory pathway TrbD component